MTANFTGLILCDCLYCLVSPPGKCTVIPFHPCHLCQCARPSAAWWSCMPVAVGIAGRVRRVLWGDSWQSLTSEFIPVWEGEKIPLDHQLVIFDMQNQSTSVHILAFPRSYRSCMLEADRISEKLRCFSSNFEINHAEIDNNSQAIHMCNCPRTEAIWHPEWRDLIILQRQEICTMPSSAHVSSLVAGERQNRCRCA